MQQPSTFAQARTIINTDGFGLRGLNKGLTSTLGRHGIFNMIYFGFYFNVKDAIPASQVNKVHSFIQPRVIPNLCGALCSVHLKRSFEEYFDCFCPYTERQWGPKQLTLTVWTKNNEIYIV